MIGVGWKVARVLPALPRSPGLDRLRGHAVVLMLLDHFLFLTNSAPFLRFTLTRFSMPCFVLCAGALCSGRFSVPRLLRRLLASSAAAALLMVAGIPGPFWLVVLVLGIEAVRFTFGAWGSLGSLVLGGLSAGYVANFGDVAHPAWGYGLLSVLVLLVLGRELAGQVDGLGLRLGARWEWPGRHALGIYVGHLAFLASVVALVGR